VQAGTSGQELGAVPRTNSLKLNGAEGQTNGEAASSGASHYTAFLEPISRTSTSESLQPPTSTAVSGIVNF